MSTEQEIEMESEDSGEEYLSLDGQGDDGAAASTAQSSQQPQPTAKKGRKPKKPPPGTVNNPCLVCNKNVTSGSVNCTLCMLWCHNKCTNLSAEALKGLEVQAKETGLAYWACKSCLSYANKVNRQFQETHRRQDETDTKVDENAKRIRDIEQENMKLKQELQNLAARMDRESEGKNDTLCEELREREIRKTNIIIHGVQEPGEGVVNNRDRMEKDKDTCEELFRAINVRTRKPDIKFCRRIGERGNEPRPIVVGLQEEAEKRLILSRARELQRTRFENVSIVPDLTKMQRRGEEKLTREAEERNKRLTGEDVNNNLRWIVVGRRGEKRLIKGTEREPQNSRGPGTHTLGNWVPPSQQQLCGPETGARTRAGNSNEGSNGVYRFADRDMGGWNEVYPGNNNSSSGGQQNNSWDSGNDSWNAHNNSGRNNNSRNRPSGNGSDTSCGSGLGGRNGFGGGERFGRRVGFNSRERDGGGFSNNRHGEGGNRGSNGNNSYHDSNNQAGYQHSNFNNRTRGYHSNGPNDFNNRRGSNSFNHTYQPYNSGNDSNSRRGNNSYNNNGGNNSSSNGFNNRRSNNSPNYNDINSIDGNSSTNQSCSTGDIGSNQAGSNNQQENCSARDQDRPTIQLVMRTEGLEEGARGRLGSKRGREGEGDMEGEEGSQPRTRQKQ